ncbi:MAG: RnfH family protein [Betaproteobacteria bacterium]|nr:RnfH family protein [Betaproteobacteria bacterium]
MGRVEAEAAGGAAADADAAPPSIRVEVAWSPAPRAVDVVALTLPAGATAAEALSASGLVSRHGLDVAALRLGVWCRACEPTAVLRDRDRVEVYRPLRVDPKEARRLRYRQHLEKKNRSG